MEYLSRSKLRNRFYPSTNYPLVCRTDGCFSKLGLYHTDIFPPDALALSRNARRGDLESEVVCISCDSSYDLSVHRKGESDDFPSESTLRLRNLQSKLRKEFRKKGKNL